MKYVASYKCPLCGRVIHYGEAREVPSNELPELCKRVVFNQQFINNPALYVAPMQIPHNCSDGSCGMAYFSGFKRV